MRLSLRLKLTLVSLLLLAIPLVSFRLSGIIKNNLMESREQTLMFSARAVASAITGRPGLLDQERFHALDEEKDIYLFELSNPMRLNGKLDDWQPQLDNFKTYDYRHQIYPQERAPHSSLHFSHMVGKRRGYLHAVFVVTDDKLVYRDKRSLYLDRSDHLQISIEDQDETLKKYIVTAETPGWVNGFMVPGSQNDAFFAINEPKIQGVWQETDDGYILEMRIPMKMIGKRLAFSIADVDNSRTKKINTVISTTAPEKAENLGLLLPISDEIAEILETLQRPNARFQVVDINKRVRASMGDLTSQNEEETEENNTLNLLRQFLTPVFSLFTEPVLTDFSAPPKDLSTFDIEGMEEVLKGEEYITRYQMEEAGVEVMAALTPLMENGRIIGAVVVEQTTNSILALKNRVIEESIIITFLAFLVSSLGLLLFATRLSTRIRKLRDQAASAVSRNGQIQGSIEAVKAKDEIGDLSQTLASLLQQLKQQIDYKEKMADNLEHEMRTPLAGISAALKNLSQEMQDQPENITNYIDWALSDARRLERLLSDIRDATNLHEALQHDQHEVFDLQQAMDIWLKNGWQMSYPQVNFALEKGEQTSFISGDPARIKQMLDKLVDNGVSFMKKGTPLTLKLAKEGKDIGLSVVNEGAHVPEDFLPHIFNSMVSLRELTSTTPHLGLGLYIARIIAEHHQGRIRTENLVSPVQGVQFTVSLPAAG